MTDRKAIGPVLKWVGGKRQLLQEILPLDLILEDEQCEV